jgi:hypothetical protein
MLAISKIIVSYSVGVEAGAGATLGCKGTQEIKVREKTRMDNLNILNIC